MADPEQKQYDLSKINTMGDFLGLIPKETINTLGEGDDGRGKDVFLTLTAIINSFPEGQCQRLDFDEMVSEYQKESELSENVDSQTFINLLSNFGLIHQDGDMVQINPLLHDFYSRIDE